MTSLDRFNLKDKVILLTGGAGLFGRGLARDLAEAGARSSSPHAASTSCRLWPMKRNARGLGVTAEQFDQGDEASILCAA